MESLDFSKSGRKAWSLLRRLGGATRQSQSKARIKPDLIAQKIVRTSKVKEDKKFTRKINKQYHRLRKRTRVNSDLSRPFTLEEVD